MFSGGRGDSSHFETNSWRFLCPGDFPHLKGGWSSGSLKRVLGSLKVCMRVISKEVSYR